jgi:hypothetical protein
MYTRNSLLTVSNCVFHDNRALYDGGGMYNEDSTLSVSGCLLVGNRAGKRGAYGASGRGAGMYNEGWFPGGSQSSVVRDCTFRDNETWSEIVWGAIGSTGGAGMYNFNCGIVVDRCTFEHNLARGSGTMGGGMVFFGGWPTPTVTNSVFDGNAAKRGGGVANLGSAEILNCTFYSNGWAMTAEGYGIITELGGAIYQYRGGTRIVGGLFSRNVDSGYGGAIYHYQPVPAHPLTITNSLFHTNQGGCKSDGYSYWDCVADHIDSDSLPEPAVSDSLFDVDPLLADPENGNFHLLAGSPAIDAGVTQKYADMLWLPLPQTDFEGDKRVVDGDGFRGAAADIGADEYVPTLAELRALIQGLAKTGQIDEGSADDLLGFVDDAQSALDDGYPENAKSSLAEMIDWLKALEDTETTELILRKAEAVYGTFD